MRHRQAHTFARIALLRLREELRPGVSVHQHEIDRRHSSRLSWLELNERVRAMAVSHAIDDDANFVHKARFGSTQYSPAFAEWLLKQHATDPKFFQKCRSSFKPAGTVHPVSDERLRWLSDFMQENDLSSSKTAQRLKIGAGTLSRLLAGKYKGDVPRMLDRIEAYRRELYVAE